MEELEQFLQTILNDNLLHLILGGPKTQDAPRKIRVRPLMHRGSLVFQAGLWDGKKEFHRNYNAQELVQTLLVWMSRDFRQMQAETTGLTATVLVSKKGKVTIKQKKRAAVCGRAVMEHNRTKQYLLPEGDPVPFLVKLGVMTEAGKVVQAKYDKFRQINRFLEFIEDIRPSLASDRELRIIDFGCGKSYLTFAVYYYLHEQKGYDVSITGLDLKEDVIRHCDALAREFGYDKLHFQVGDIANYVGGEQVDLVITLHACDTATDFALAKAVGWGAKAILSVPCCQHELNGQLQNDMLQPVLKYGLLKERMAALITDGLRASMLEEAGYQVQVLEFIDMEHTPKNIMIRAVRRNTAPAGRIGADGSSAGGAGADAVSAADSSQNAEPLHTSDALTECMAALHVHPTLAALLGRQQ